MAEVLTVEHEDAGGELLRGRLVDQLDPPLAVSGARSIVSSAGLKSSTRKSSGTSTCLGVRPPRSTLSELAITSIPPMPWM